MYKRATSTIQLANSILLHAYSLTAVVSRCASTKSY